MEPATLRGGFTCAFTTRACSHAPIFASQYKRTNRTKGLKIMRCFPHCCPRHQSRSYCGAPVYLQVDWDGPLDPVSGKGISSLDEQQLRVVARFRTKDHGGFSVGQDVPSALITGSLQDASDPDMEWISASVIASANRNSWLFEINKLARWSYRWEVGATRERRFKAHIFEAYLFYDAGDHRIRSGTDGKQSWRVLAVASSPSFTLVSSRRARRNGGKPSAQYEEDEEEETQDNDMGFDAADERAEYPYYLRESDDAQEQKQQESRAEPEATGTAAVAPPLLNSAQTIAQQFAVLAWFLDQLPLTSLLLYVGQVESDYITALLDELQDPNIVDRIQRKRKSSASTAVVLSRLLVSAAASTSSSSAPNSQSSQPTIEPRAIQQALGLAVWLLFDKHMGEQMNQFLGRSSHSMLDRATLSKSYTAWLQWLRTQTDDMLVGQLCSTENLVNAICNHYAADIDLSQQSAECVDRAAWQTFVAHLREVYLSTVPLNHAARLARHRLQPLPLPSSSSSTVLSGYTGTWFCGLEDVRLHNSSGRSSSSNASASVLLWFWRQLSCISLTFTHQESSAVLLLSSVFNRSLSENQLTQLVLDNQPRWFRCLPCGASTIAMPLIGQRFGDYTARFSSENCLLVQTYSWPSTSGAGCYGYCWRWQIAQTGRSDLRVFLKVERGYFKSSEPENPGHESERLAEKLQRIERWEPVYELQLAYSRLY